MALSRRLQWQADILVDAPLERTWAVIDDLSLIPQYHPVVRSVELSSGVRHRVPGVEYKCIVPAGSRRGWCVEKVIESIPQHSTTVAFTDDSWGLSKLIDNFVTEVSVQSSGVLKTQIVFQGFYNPKGWWGAILNALVLRRNMRKRATDTLRGLKRLLENKSSPDEE